MADKDPMFSKPDDEGGVWSGGRLGGTRLRNGPSRTKIIVIGLLAGLLPSVVFFEHIQRTTENGAVTSYHYLNFVAIVGGIIALICGWRLVKMPRTTVTMALVFALTLLGMFQVLRGAGVFPYITNCESEKYADLCTYTGD